MMDEYRDYDLTDLDRSTLERVANVVRKRPPEIIEAGRWLDTNYSTSAIRDRREAERQKTIALNKNIEEHNRDVCHRHIDGLKGISDSKRRALHRKADKDQYRLPKGEGLPWSWQEPQPVLDAITDDEQSKHSRFLNAWRRVFNDPIHIKDQPNEREIACRMLLLAWIITDRQSHETIDFCLFHKGWPWIPSDTPIPNFHASTTDECLDRFYTRHVLLSPLENCPGWIRHLDVALGYFNTSPESKGIRTVPTRPNNIDVLEFIQTIKTLRVRLKGKPLHACWNLIDDYAEKLSLVSKRIGLRSPLFEDTKIPICIGESETKGKKKLLLYLSHPDGTSCWGGFVAEEHIQPAGSECPAWLFSDDGKILDEIGIALDLWQDAAESNTLPIHKMHTATDIEYLRKWIEHIGSCCEKTQCNSYHAHDKESLNGKGAMVRLSIAFPEVVKQLDEVVKHSEFPATKRNLRKLSSAIKDALCNIDSTEHVGEFSGTTVSLNQQPTATGLIVDSESREIRFKGECFKINAGAEFLLFRELVKHAGKMVLHGDLLRAIKPDAIDKTADIKDAPQEVKDCLRGIRQAIKSIHAPISIKSIKGQGYKLVCQVHE